MTGHKLHSRLMAAAHRLDQSNDVGLQGTYRRVLVSEVAAVVFARMVATAVAYRLILSAYCSEFKRSSPVAARAVREAVAAAAASLRVQPRLARRVHVAFPVDCAAAARSAAVCISYSGQIASRGTLTVAGFVESHAFELTAILVAIGAGTAIGLFA
jgi:hypothetical protein